MKKKVHIIDETNFTLKLGIRTRTLEIKIEIKIEYITFSINKTISVELCLFKLISYDTIQSCF